MATLTGQSIASSYEQLLHVDADGGGNSTTHVSVKDGDNGTTFGFTIASDALMMSSTNRLEFGDTGTYINQSGDGILNITSDTEVEINATEVDLNGTLDVSGTLTQGGASQFNSTITVGVDNTGYDVKLFGATSGAYALWDESADNLILAGGAGIVEAGGALKENLLTNSGFDVWSNGTFENVGSDLVSNGAISGTGSWTAGNSALLADDGGKLRVTFNSGGQPYAYQDITTVIGKLYKLSVDVGEDSTDTGSTYVLKVTTTGGTVMNQVKSGGGLNTAGGTEELNTFIFEATATTSRIRLEKDNEDAGGILFDNITCFEVTPGCVAADQLAMDGWGKQGGADLWRQHNDGGTLTHDGSFYSLKLLGGSTSDIWWPKGFYDEDIWSQRFAGRTVTFGAWIKATDVSSARLRLYDGSFVDSDYHTGGGAWEWIEMTHNCGASIVRIEFYIASGIGNTAYISQPMLVFGSSIGEGNYTRPQGEIVWCEKNIPVISDNTIGRDGSYTFENNRGSLPARDPIAGDDEILGLEQMSGGRIPKGAMAVYLIAEVENSSITSNQGIRWGRSSSATENVEINPIVNDIRQMGNGWIGCDSNGDIYQEVTEGGATLSELTVKVSGVQLR